MEVIFLDYNSGNYITTFTNTNPIFKVNQGVTLDAVFDDYTIKNGDFNIVWTSQPNENKQTILVKYIEGTGQRIYSQKVQVLIRESLSSLNSLSNKVKQLDTKTINLINDLKLNLQKYL